MANEACAAFNGKWVVDLSQTEGLEEFGEVLGKNGETMKQLANLSYYIEYDVKGDNISGTVCYDCDFPTHTYNFKLGEPFDYHAVDGSEPKLTVTMDGSKMVDSYELGEAKWTTVREIESPGVMKCTTTLLGKTVIQKLRKN